MASTNRSSAAGFEVTIGGTTLTQKDGEGVEMLVVEDHVDMIDLFTLRMGGAPGNPAWSWKVGDDVKVKVGKCTSEIFVGQAIGLEPGYQVEGISSLNVRALDKMHILSRGRKTRYFEDMKDSDVVSQVASEAGLEIGSVEGTSTTYPYILQRNESDIAFLKRLAARNNYLLRMEAGKLAFKKAQFSGGSFTLKMSENLRALKVSYNSADMVQKVVVRSWDIMTKTAIVGEATTGDIQKIGGGQLGADLAGQFGNATAYITDVPVSSQAMANAVAKAEMERIARQFCHGTGSIQGNDAVRAGSMINFAGLSSPRDGKYYIVSSRHVISNRSGYSTEFTFCSNTYGS